MGSSSNARPFFPVTMLLAFSGMFAIASLSHAQPPATLPAPPTTQSTALPLEGTIHVTGFRYTGNTKLSAAQLDTAVRKILSKHNLTMEDLEQARQALTMAYVDAGYINSGAILPDQSVEGGLITFNIVEGKLTNVDLKGNQRLRQSYITSRVWPDAGEPLNILTLKNNLEILRLNPNLRSINAELKPGLLPGQATLDTTVHETWPYQLALEFDNRRSPSIGAERFSLLASDSNLTGVSDSLAVRWGLTKGGLEDIRWAGSSDVSADYTIPLNARDTTLEFNFTNSDSLVVQTPFTSLNIQSRTESFALTLRHPFYRTPDTDFAVFVTAARRYNKTFLAGAPFSFAPGAHSGESDVTVLRLGQEYNHRTTDYALALRSTFSFGIDALGATTNPDSVADSHFFTWLFQAQHVRRLFGSDNQIIFRFATQVSADPLLSLEQFSIGGLDTVRGYRENELVRDNGMIGSIELRIPLLQKQGQAILTFAPFVDIGYGWNSRAGDNSVPPDLLLPSTGIGFLFTPNSHVNGQIYWGIPFKNVKDSGHNIQDEGIHFDLIISAF